MHKTNEGMGCKDLTTFNLTMLGKQGWKFIMEPGSLVSRLFKARYFPNKTYLTATIDHNPNYVWRSILRDRFIIHGGARWSIGAGTSIPILGEPWVLNGECIDNNIFEENYGRHINIDNLMVPTEKRWNKAAVLQVFSARLAYKIMSTPLIAHVQSYCLIWKVEKNGKYSVKSAYRLYVKELIDYAHLRRPKNWSEIGNLKYLLRFVI